MEAIAYEDNTEYGQTKHRSVEALLLITLYRTLPYLRQAIEVTDAMDAPAAQYRAARVEPRPAALHWCRQIKL